MIIEPIPMAMEADDPLNCLSSASSLDECSYQANGTRTPLENYYASIIEAGAAWSIDLDRVVCPRLPLCDPVVGGLIVKRDANHITATYAAAIADEVDAALRQAGVLTD